MGLRDFIESEVERIETQMRSLSHKTMMGNSGVDSEVLISMGKYRQLKSERDRWLELRKKQNEPDSMMEDMPDDETSAPPPASKGHNRRARAWGGT